MEHIRHPKTTTASLTWQAFFSIAIALVFYSCNPKVFEFKAENMGISAADSVRLHWKIRGKPTLYMHEKHISFDGHPLKIFEFTLLAEKDGKTPARGFRQIEIYPEGEVPDILTLAELNLEGDSVLVAKGIKSHDRFDKFEIIMIASASRQGLTVLHQSKTVFLDSAGMYSTKFKGLPYSGEWIFRTSLTSEEKKDHSRLPDTLAIKAIITLKK